MNKSATKILIVSNYPQFLSDFFGQLSQEFTCERANSESQLLFLFSEWEPLLIIIDADSAFIQSIGLIKDRLNAHSHSLICFGKELSPPKEEKALRAGADLATTLPLTYSCLQARLLAQLRKINMVPKTADKYKENLDVHADFGFANINLVSTDEIIKRNDQIVTASSLQFKLLKIFLNNKDQLLSRQFIKEQVWKNANISPRSIDAHISKLKRLLPELEEHLVNIYGKGYIFTKSRDKIVA